MSYGAAVPTPLDRISDLRLGDLQIFLAVRRWASVTGAARALHVTPSQVSKAVARLEAELGISLLSRRARGVAPTASAERLLEHFEEVVRRVERIRAAPPAPELTVAAPSFLNALLLPVIAERRPGERLRGVELPPALVRAYAAEHLFDVALTLGEERFPDPWVDEPVGEVRKALFASPAIAAELGPAPVAQAQLADLPFIAPIYNHHGRFMVADEGCPLGAERRIGHEVHTMAMALELAARTGQLVFGPAVAARAHVERGALVEIRVRGWDVRDPVHAAFNGERVLARTQKELCALLREELGRWNGDR
jgi:DNA-binding transcriptional LysR family regulator